MLRESTNNWIVLFKKSWLVFIPLLVILIIYSSELLDPTQPIKFFSLAVFCLIFNCALIFNIKKHDLVILKHPIVKVYGVYLIISTISLSYTNSLISGINEVFRIFLAFNFLLLGAYFLKSKKHFKLNYLLHFFSILQVIIVVTTIIQILKSPSDIVLFETKIPGGLFTNSNLCSQILFLSLPFSLYGIYQSNSNLNKAYTIITTLAVISLILLLGSKSVFIALFVMMIVIISIYSFQIRPTKGRMIYIIVGFFILIIGITTVLSYYSTTISKINSLQVREELWSRTFLSIKDKPILGHGIGSWRVTNWDYLVENKRDPENRVMKYQINTIDGSKSYERPHNDFLWILSEIGIVGFLSYSLLFIITIYFSIRAINHIKGEKNMLYLFLTGSLVGYVAIALFSFPKERIEQIILLTIIFILIIDSTSSQKKSLHVSKKFNRIISILLIAISSFSVYFGFKRLVSEYHFTKAILAQQNNNWRLLFKNSLLSKNIFYPYGSNGTPVDWYLGLASISLNQLGPAHSYFLEAYEENRNHVHVLNNLATTNVMQGHISQGKDLYLKALQINPNFEDARINLSAIYFNQGNIKEAWENISKVPYRSEHPRYRSFLDVIIRERYYSEFINLANNKNLLEPAKVYLNSDKRVFYRLYRLSSKRKEPIEETYIEKLKYYIKKNKLK